MKSLKVLFAIFLASLASLTGAEPEVVSSSEKLTILRLPSVWKFQMVSALAGPNAALKAPQETALAALQASVLPTLEDADWSDFHDNTGGGWEKQGANNPLGLGVLRQRVSIPQLNLHPHWYLVVPGVDEDVWLYLNGELVAEQSWQASGLTPDDLWNTPLVCEVTGKLPTADDVLIAMGIFNRAGMGGLYTAVYLVGSEQELTPGEAVTALPEDNPYGYSMPFRRKYASADTTGRLAQAIQDNWTPYRKFLEKRQGYATQIISYGEHPQQEIYLSIPLQQTEGPFPVVVWYHGGGLTIDGPSPVQTLWNNRLAIAEVRYRTSGVEATAVDALEDSTAALAWILDHIADYGGNPKSVFIGGISAGGWLSGMIGMNPNLLAKYGHSHHELKGLILVTGQMTTHFQLKHDLHYERLGTIPVIDEYAPIYWMAPDVPPLVCITGSEGFDMAGRPAENAYMVQMLKVLGHPDATHIVLDGFTHAATGENCGYSVMQFINRLLK